ncbi:uncharacterized protein LOC121906389 isoform X1 [Thunnus maccoyii]|uniref:uncharacterized protein LOC121906389 isoform X1 n=1 Tax=Thunnus maccoyii TaxID=8240 RepID=UPI001C4B760C|nr:uncharacterized protein LOC121906389 isoform X1 [Thunnus maccoyii]
MFILYSKSKFSRKYHSVRSSLLKCEIWDLFQQGWIYDFSDPDSFAPGRQLHLQKMPEGKHAEPQSDVEGSNTDDAPSDDCIKAQDNSIGRKKYMLYLEPQSTSGLLRGLKRSTLQRQQQLVVQSVLDAALNIPAASALPAPSDDDAAPSDDDVALSDRAQNIIRQHLGFMNTNTLPNLDGLSSLLLLANYLFKS